MTIPSLQKIVDVENELLAAEEQEREKARLWLEEQARELQNSQRQQLAELEAGRESVRLEARKEAEKKAAAIAAEAEQYAARIAGLADDALARFMRQYLVAIISGRAP